MSNSNIYHFPKNIDDDELFVSINKNKINKNVDDSLGVSWASIVEDELGDSIEDKLMTSGVGNTSSLFDNKPQITDINEIMELKYNKLQDVIVLQYQSYVTSQLRKTVKTFDTRPPPDTITKETIDLIVKNLKWISSISKYLSNKIGLLPTDCEKELQDVIKNTKNIPRSSYKFCTHSYDCDYNYGKDANGCYSQHFVHNLINADIQLLQIHIEINELTSLNLVEIKKCINTLSYVINHMYEELRHIEFFNKGQSDKLHRNKVIKINKSNNLKKKNIKKKNYKKNKNKK